MSDGSGRGTGGGARPTRPWPARRAAAAAPRRRGAAQQPHSRRNCAATLGQQRRAAPAATASKVCGRGAHRRGGGGPRAVAARQRAGGGGERCRRAWGACSGRGAVAELSGGAANKEPDAGRLAVQLASCRGSGACPRHASQEPGAERGGQPARPAGRQVELCPGQPRLGAEARGSALRGCCRRRRLAGGPDPRTTSPRRGGRHAGAARTMPTLRLPPPLPVRAPCSPCGLPCRRHKIVGGAHLTSTSTPASANGDGMHALHVPPHAAPPCTRRFLPRRRLPPLLPLSLGGAGAWIISDAKAPCCATSSGVSVRCRTTGRS